jgi:hypothetical protein
MADVRRASEELVGVLLIPIQGISAPVVRIDVYSNVRMTGNRDGGMKLASDEKRQMWHFATVQNPTPISDNKAFCNGIGQRARMNRDSKLCKKAAATRR